MMNDRICRMASRKWIKLLFLLNSLKFSLLLFHLKFSGTERASLFLNYGKIRSNCRTSTKLCLSWVELTLQNVSLKYKAIRMNFSNLIYVYVYTRSIVKLHAIISRLYELYEACNSDFHLLDEELPLKVFSIYGTKWKFDFPVEIS